MQISPEETTQLIDLYADKQHLITVKDLNKVYTQIYEEKVNQVWRFSHIKVG